MSLKYRIACIVALVVASDCALFPRTVVERVKRNDVYVLDTVRRVPLRKGLDLQGGTHVTLEVDDSKTAVANKSEAIDRALKVVRTRVDQFGVSEPVVQKVGNDRIIVELPGIDDPQHATDIIQKSAFLEFQIADKTNALNNAMARIDAAAKNLAASIPNAKGQAAAPDTTKNALQGLFSNDTAKKSAKDSTKGHDSGQG